MPLCMNNVWWTCDHSLSECMCRWLYIHTLYTSILGIGFRLRLYLQYKHFTSHLRKPGADLKKHRETQDKMAEKQQQIEQVEQAEQTEQASEETESAPGPPGGWTDVTDADPQTSINQQVADQVSE